VTAPDIRLGDFIRVYANTGARRRGRDLHRTMVLEVIALGDPPGRPDWRFVGGRICRTDMSHAQQLQHTCLELSGRERSILNLAGQWQLLRRPVLEDGDDGEEGDGGGEPAHADPA
jgi:hypothetical protein